MIMIENQAVLANKEFIAKRRVVVTGIGMVTPLGLNAEATWANLIAGKSGITPIEEPKLTQVNVVGQVRNFDPTLFGIMSPKELKRISRPSQLSVIAAFEALRNAGLLDSDNKLSSIINAEHVGVKIGTGIGGATEIAGISEDLKAGKKYLRMLRF